MELMIKMSAAEADEAMAKGLIQALVYPFSSRETVRQHTAKNTEKSERAPESAPVTQALENPAVPTTEQSPAQAVPTSTVTYTAADLQKAAVSLMDQGRQEDLLNLLQQFGVPSLPALPQEQYGRFALGLRKLGARI